MRLLVAVFITCMLSGAGYAWADGSVAIKNETNRTINLQSYDWDDSTKNVPYEKKDVSPGGTTTIHCHKSWWSSSAPGCYITIIFASKPWFEKEKMCNTGSDSPYRVTGDWDYSNSEGYVGMDSLRWWDPDPKPRC